MAKKAKSKAKKKKDGKKVKQVAKKPAGAVFLVSVMQLLVVRPSWTQRKRPHLGLTMLHSCKAFVDTKKKQSATNWRRKPMQLQLFCGIKLQRRKPMQLQDKAHPQTPEQNKYNIIVSEQMQHTYLHVLNILYWMYQMQSEGIASTLRLQYIVEVLDMSTFCNCKFTYIIPISWSHSLLAVRLSAGVLSQCVLSVWQLGQRLCHMWQHGALDRWSLPKAQSDGQSCGKCPTACLQVWQRQGHHSHNIL